MTKRKPITDGMKLLSLFYVGGIRCARCGKYILHSDKIEWDHSHPLALGGPHHFTNIRPLHAECHGGKTRGTGATTAGSDVGKIAKAKRIAKTGKMVVCRKDSARGDMRPTPKRPWPKGRKLQGRPFQKRKKAA